MSKAKDKLIETLAEYFGLDLPEYKNGEYDIHNKYSWVAGCSMGGGFDAPWLTLENVVDALSDFCDDYDYYAECDD